MSQLPLEDQLRSMILKNSGPSDLMQPASTGQLPPENGSSAAAQEQAQQFPPLPPPGTRHGRHQNRSQSHHLPSQNVNAVSGSSPRPARHGPHHGPSHSASSRPYFGPGSPQQRQHGFQPQNHSPGYVPPHMRNRSSEWQQQRGGFHQHRGSWHHHHHHQAGHSGPAPVGQPSSPGNFGPRHNYRQSAPAPLQILQRPNLGAPSNTPFHPGPPLHNPNNPDPRYQQYQQKQQEQYQQQQQEKFQAQCRYLEAFAAVEIPRAAMTDEELREKQDFVDRLQAICENGISSLPDVPTIQFKCFGSIGTGFATKGSDIDLAVITTNEDDTERAQKVGPRVLEKLFLDHGFGARLLTNTRIPIIKFCENPSDELRANLKAERKKWDDLPEEEKIAVMEGRPKSAEGDKEANTNEATPGVDAAGGKDASSPKDEDGSEPEKKASAKRTKSKSSGPKDTSKDPNVDSAPQERPAADGDGGTARPSTNADGSAEAEAKNGDAPQKREIRQEKPWLREKPMGPLDFPKDGVGIQCDLNFAGHLGIYNTRLLHCYAISDQRIRDMVIFVKAWAKKRKINSSYNGTLSSYGYALMVLHYLMRIPEEPVTPDLQLLSNVTTDGKTPEVVDVICNGYVVKFLADEEYIQEKVRTGQWTRNQDSLGSLLRGFFRYYGCPGVPDRVGGFHWTRDVITFGQRKPWEKMVTKEELGWTKARIEKDSKKEVRHRYLVCIQDPFELDHNVGRTVNHQGICAIREEFRRAWRILEDEAHGRPHKYLFATVDEDPPPPQYVGGGPPPNKATTTTTAAADQAATDAQARKDHTRILEPSLNLQEGSPSAPITASDPKAAPETPRRGIVSMVDGARRPSAGGANGFGAEAIAKVNGKLAEAAARKNSLK